VNLWYFKRGIKLFVIKDIFYFIYRYKNLKKFYSEMTKVVNEFYDPDAFNKDK
jgi:hypothetical protein